MNNLIAAPAAGPGEGDLYKCVEITNSIYNAVDAFTSGDPIKGFFDTAMAAVDIAAAIVDPVATLASSIANIMMTYMWPLPDLLDSLVGSPSEVQAMAQTWINIQTQLETASADLTNAANGVQAEWVGDAANAYRELSTTLGQMMDGVAAGAAGVASALQGSSAIIELIRTIVVQLVSALVGSLISYFATALATLGTGAPAIVVQASLKISDTAGKAAKWSDELVEVTGKVARFISSANEKFEVALPFVRSTSETMSLISVKDILTNSRQFAETITATPGASS